MSGSTAFDEMPKWKQLIWMSMTGKERLAFKRYAVMRGGDPVAAFDHWIKRHSADEYAGTPEGHPR